VSKIIVKALENGLVIISAGADIIRFVPPLVITEKDVDEMIRILDQTLTECGFH
jgi:acetylornithine/N-succinyldiaminopimelate aminotransferase